MYDNLENAKQKLQNTFCYYDNRAVYVKEVSAKYKNPESPKITEVKISCLVSYMDSPKGTHWVQLEDPKFQYMEFNTGYINSMGYALWYYRIPHKQWKQGIT